MDVARCVAEISCCAESLGAACTPPGLPSSVCNEPTQPLRTCSPELVSALWHSTRTPRREGPPWVWTIPGSARERAPPGMPLVEPGLEGWQRVDSGGAGVVLGVSSEPGEDRQCSLPASPFQSPVSGTWRLSLPLPPPSSPQHPSASLGWISSIPEQLLLHRQHRSCPYRF